jgi:CNP1-like family
MKVPDARGAAWRPIAALAAFAIFLGGCASSSPPDLKAQQRGMTKDVGGVPEEKAFKEIEVSLPKYPQDGDLLEFLPRRNSPNRFFIDRDSISIGADRVVRYSTVIKSPSGAVNTSYEGLRCKTSEYKVYAFGTDGGEWAKVPDVQWRKILRLSPDFRFALYKDYFCDIEAIAGRNEKDLVARLAGNLLNNASLRNR